MCNDDYIKSLNGEIELQLRGNGNALAGLLYAKDLYIELKEQDNELPKKVFCKRCKFLVLHRWVAQYRCSKKENEKIRDTAYKRYTYYPRICEVNANNDCKYFEKAD